MDFIILKVNGQDVSKASHEDALRTFQAAQQPIVVEVLRRAATGGIRSDANRNNRAEYSATEEQMTVSTQTEMWQWPCSDGFPATTPPFHEDEEDIEGSLDDPAEPDVDLEEVVLHRGSTSERLGLTLYYPDGDDAAEETDVLVQSVEPGGIACRDGRVQPGDQIIQINGEEVSSKEQAERLLATRPDVQLLLCRPAIQGNDDGPAADDDKDDDKDDDIADVRCQQNIDNRVCDCASPTGERGGSLEKRDTMKSGGSSSSSGGSSSHDSRGGKPATSSPTAALTIDRELYLVNKQMVGIQQECESLAAQRRQVTSGRPRVEEHIYETIPECSEPEEPLYSQPYCPSGRENGSAGAGGGVGAGGRLPPPPGCTRSRREVERWIRSSVPEPLPEPEPVEAWQCTSSTNDSQSSADSKPARRGRKDAADEKDSSSAYNTGDSSRSTPLTLELGLVADEANRELHESTLTLTAPTPRPSAPTPQGSTRDHSLQVNFDSDTYSEVSCKNCRKCMRLPPLQQTPTKNKNIINSVNAVEKNRNYVTFLPYQTHYTNAENLAEIMQHQQRQLYQQVMKRTQTTRTQLTNSGQQAALKQQTPQPFGASLQQYRFVSSPGGGPRNHSSTLPVTGGAGGQQQYQYKVKVRSDGSRYIARRPVRNKLLKEREARINEERAGLTTDDDAVSELKLGRYWTRDEKKKQLERSRERKQKQQQRLKMAALPEEAATEDASATKRQGWQPGVDAAVQRRPTAAAAVAVRRKPHAQEEFLRHAKPPKPAEPLLSVTTV